MKVGSFLKGVGSGLQMFPQIQELKWKKAERKAIEKEKEDWKEAISIFQGKLDEYSTDGNLSYGEQIDILSASSGLGHEYMNVMQDWISNVNQGNRELAKQKAEEAAAYRDFILNTGFPIEGVDTILSKDTMKYIQQGNILKETGGKTGEAIGSQMWKERGFGEIPMTPEKLSDLEKKIAGIEKLPLTKERKNELKIKIYAGGDSAIAEKVRAIYAAGGTNEDVVKALGGGVIGAEPTKVTPTPAPTSTENIREDILNADTFKDAERIYDNYAKKYDVSALGITNLKQEWGNNQISYLNNIKTTIENIIDEKGWLKKGTITQAEVGYEFKGDQPVEEIYKKLREEYMKYRDMLEKLGIDVSQFPILKPLEEIEKVGLGEGFWGWGKQKGQYKSIYR